MNARWLTRCAHCDGTAKRAYFSDETRRHRIARCSNCRANFHGPGVSLPEVNDALLDVDPCAACAHGDGPHLQDSLL